MPTPIKPSDVNVKEPIVPAAPPPAPPPAPPAGSPAKPATPLAGGVVGTHVTGLAGSPATLNPNGQLWVQAANSPVITGVCMAIGQSPQVAPMVGAICAYSASGLGLWVQGSPAASFQGDVTVTGTVTASDVILPNADCAEEFDVSALAAAGDVMVLDEKGALRRCTEAYDRKVAGVVSGAGDFRPAITLDRRGEASPTRLPIALVGKVYCKVDASHGPVAVGDLLTTSTTPGYAMKASDPARAFGAIIGKALRALDEGQDLVPILVALQ